ncbi:MAG TPA: hypothetical protein VK537_09245 [Galbitalea sp.]|nr:hypothetical protein [Galbitalea sp.]
MSPAFILTRRIVQLLVGLFLYGIAISLMVQAGIGVAPWDVLTQGLSHQTGLDFGLLTNIIGGVVLLCWIPIRQRPGLGTLANVLLIGPSAQLGLWIFPKETAIGFQLLFFVGGLLLLAIATGLYIGARMGPGPRDGLMTGIHARTGWRLWAIRTAIEVTVLLIGWALGGNFGPGTIVFALLIGPMVAVTIPWLWVPEAKVTSDALERRETEPSPLKRIATD